MRYRQIQRNTQADIETTEINTSEIIQTDKHIDKHTYDDKGRVNRILERQI